MKTISRYIMTLALLITAVGGAWAQGYDVTLNDTKTEASFEMPTSDVDVSYELVRDMSVQMTATMGDGTDGVRYRVKKAQQGEGYEPADMNMTQVLALVAVNDGIEQKDLTLDQDYFCRIYKLDEQTQQPTGDGVNLADFDFAPGLYALKAFAKDDSDYDGETALSNTFKLFQGYEVTVPVGEYITYYSNEALTLDEGSGAELYTITRVDENTATLSDAVKVMPKETPMLVYNMSSEGTILLIPTEDQADDVTPATEFIGTTTATTIPASTSSESNYAFNGKDFVWVKNSIEIGANKCWISITKASSVRSITLVNNSPTAIGATLVNSEEVNSEEWFDLNGRKVNKPTKKGIYIKNGKKVVILK